MTLLTNGADKSYAAGAIVGAGTFRCEGCGQGIAVRALEKLPICRGCGGSRYRRASLFERPTSEEPVLDPTTVAEQWLRRVRDEVAGPALAIRDPDPRLFTPAHGWTRIGRSPSAGLRLDDPTVSRRHAVVIRTTDDSLRVLDDRSLNGVFVNGERVEWSPLGDGDELVIGRFGLRIVLPSGSTSPPARSAGPAAV